MAVRVFRAAAVLVVALFLGSCGVVQFIFGSVFPSTTALLQSRADLSTKITATDGYNYNLRVVESQGSGYVVLNSNATGLPVYIYDLSLNLKKVLTGLTSSGAMVDGFTGDIIIGNLALNPSDLSLAATQPPAGAAVDSMIPAGSDAFFTGSGGFNVANLNIAYGSSTLNFNTFDSLWVETYTSPGPALSAVQTSLALSAILDDGNTADMVILAVTLLNGAALPTTYFLRMPRSDFNTITPGGAGALDSSQSRDGLLANTLGFAGGDLIAWDISSQSFLRMDPVTLKTTASFYAPAQQQNMSRLKFAYRAEGGSFYEYDPNTRVISEYTAWW